MNLYQDGKPVTLRRVLEVVGALVTAVIMAIAFWLAVIFLIVMFG